MAIPTVLVVDDEPSLLELVRRILQADGCHVLLASTSGDALTMAREYPGSIDVVLSDFDLPDRDGPSTAKQLVDERPAMRVVFMSGHSQDVLVADGTLAPDRVFLRKPFTKAILLGTVRRALIPQSDQSPSYLHASPFV